jgi:hypothetical protein
MAKLNMVKALNLALLQEMERDRDVLILGEDVGVDGGVFRVTDDLQRKFGSQRVIDSPLAEAAIIGTAVGMALYGLKPVCEIQFSGFAFQCFHQIENHAARYRMRSQGRFHCQMVIRMPYGGGVRALEHHTESEEQFYAHIPGLKMVVPSGPRTARALLAAAIRDPDPVVFFEAKALYQASIAGRGGEILEDGETSHARSGLLEKLDALRGEIPRQDRHAGEVLSRVRKTCHEPLGDGIARDEQDWDRRRRSLGRPRGCLSVRDEGVHFEPDEFGGKWSVPLGNAVRVALLDDEIAALDPPELLESLPEWIQGEGFGIGKQPADPGQAGLLPLDDERRGQEAQGTSDEAPPVHYSMISSARASTDGGIVRPRAFAVLRLITSSNRVACSTGRSAGFAPLSILATYEATRRCMSPVPAP